MEEDKEREEEVEEKKDECGWCKKLVRRGELVMVDEEDLCKACVEGSDLYFISNREWKIDSLREEVQTNEEEIEEELSEKEIAEGEQDGRRLTYEEVKKRIEYFEEEDVTKGETIDVRNGG